VSTDDASIAVPPNLTACIVRALVLYSLAEFQVGHAATIRVNAEGISFTVADDGRGHAIERAVGGSPYLKFVYTHLDYPFETAQDSPIQLHGIGMSLINTLCSELTVTVRKRDATLRMTFRDGQLSREDLTNAQSEETGNTISGTVRPQLQKDGTDPGDTRQWLLGILAASPSLKLYFNGEALHADPPNGA
jgi:DNA gyrase/topoisomerase IV subunit B